MQFSFDLLSDLHVETWDDFDWTYKPTSPYCVVAGDVARDHTILAETLRHLGTCYQAVFYIDGNDEHRYHLGGEIGNSYKNIGRQLKRIKNVVYLQDNVVIINGVAILATNGWWTYDFDDRLDADQSLEWYRDRMNITHADAATVASLGMNDAAYMVKSVAKLQTHQDVKSIVMVTHTVPTPWVMEHDIELVDTYRFNCMGNNNMQHVFDEDTERKIKTWCFGHYHKNVDNTYNGVRFVNNCRGRGDTDWKQSVYQPLKITIEI